jgi:hypothetical protein
VGCVKAAEPGAGLVHGEPRDAVRVFHNGGTQGRIKQDGGGAVAPIVIESTPASDQLSNTTRRAFQDLITTLAARFSEKGLPHKRSVQLATNVWTSLEGALILRRALRSPEPFDMAIALLTAAADGDR